MDSRLLVEEDQSPRPNGLAPVGAAVTNGAGSESLPAARVDSTRVSPGLAESSKVLSRLLRMAETYRAAGNLRQALEMYFELVEQHPLSGEATMAGDILLEVAEDYEENGEFHSARSIYERML